MVCPVKSDAVASDPPENRHEAGDTKALRQDGEHVLAADQAAVKERQTRKSQEQHEGGASHLPGVYGQDQTRWSARSNIALASSVRHVSLQVGDALLKTVGAGAAVGVSRRPIR